MKNLDTKLLKSFISVAQTGSMTFSAANTHQTQGAISQQVKRLENLLGQKLFIRSGRGLTLTAGGDQLLPLAINVVAACGTIFDQFQKSKLSKSIRFGMPNDLVPVYLSSILDQFTENFPEIDVDLYCDASSRLKEMVHAKELDLVMIEEPVSSAVGYTLRVEPLVWIGKTGGKAYLKRPLPVSLVAQSCTFRPSVERALAAKDLMWRAVFENGDLNATMATVRSDISVTACLKSLTPSNCTVLSQREGLPELGSFAISLYPQDRELRGADQELFATIQRVFQP